MGSYRGIRSRRHFIGASVFVIFKYPEKAREFTKLHPRLRRILYAIEYMAWYTYMDEIVITEMFRNDHKSVHHYGRGADIAILETGKEQGTERIRKAVNILFPYGKDGYDTASPLRHGTGPHLHVQVKG